MSCSSLVPVTPPRVPVRALTEALPPLFPSPTTVSARGWQWAVPVPAERLWHGGTRTAGRRGPGSGERSGVTLLELLVVLVVIALTATMAIPEFRLPINGETDPVAVGRQLLNDARRMATRRGEPVRLKVAHDGVWALVSVNDGGPLAGGRVTVALTWYPDVTIDAMGTCMLAPGVVPPEQARGWDALGCQWRVTEPVPGPQVGARSP